VASLTEDAYGTLQQDIPKVLECLTSMLLALEDYERELKTSHTELTDDMVEVDRTIVTYLHPLTDGECLYRIPPSCTNHFRVYRHQTVLEGNHFRIWGPFECV
jgi:hypothetical protein